MRAIIETKELRREFGPVTAVDALSLAVMPGEVFGLLGPNGAGKTTTIKMLITLLPPTSGSATVAGHDVVHQQRLVRRSIGYVSQLLSSDGALSARENLDISGRLYHIPTPERSERMDTALAFMGLADVGDNLVRTYSGGMVRRLEIAQAMLHQPQVLFLDEPTVGLDPTARRAVWEHIRRLRDREGTTILLTTHYMDEAAELCERVGIMHLGKLVALGTPESLAAEIGPGATLDDVFTIYTGGDLDEGGTYRVVARTRRTARRLG
ncbi:MAG: ATP-binding cassette domain-containing protein [Candidatus Limnocylindrales bacterium]